ncbi:TPA: oxalyl-CoA decarboxylase, partial [Escherichia coli]
DLLHHARYDKLMDAFRGVGYNVTTTDELRHALTTGIQSRKPTIINVVIDPAAGTESGHITKLNPKQVAGN